MAVTCAVNAAGPDGGTVEIEVCDTGRGIAPEKLDRIFEPFVQVDRHLTHDSQQGVGLGLAISRDLARAMGGELTAASGGRGTGAAFTLTLPRGSTAGVAAPRVGFWTPGIGVPAAC